MATLSALQDDTLGRVNESVGLFSEHGVVGLSLLVVVIIMIVLGLFIWLNFKDRRQVFAIIQSQHKEDLEERRTWRDAFEKHSDRQEHTIQQNTKVINQFTEEIRKANLSHERSSRQNYQPNH